MESCFKTEEIEYCKYKVMYEAPVSQVRAKRKEAVNQLRRGKIQGFRPGKAPDQVIEMKMKKQIEDWLKTELVRSSYESYSAQDGVKLLVDPQLQNIQLHNDEFWCDFITYQKPVIQLLEYKNFEIPKPAPKYTETELVEKTLQDLRIQKGITRPYEENEFVEMSDKITLAVEFWDATTYDEQEIKNEELSQDGILYTVGSNQIPGLDEQLLGMNPGDERTFYLSHAGRDRKCIAKVYMGLKLQPAPLDQELATYYGFESVENMEEQVTSLAKNQLVASEEQAIHHQILNRLITNHQNAKIPAWYTQAQAQDLARQQSKVWKDLSETEQKHYIGMAERGILAALLLETVRETEPESVYNENELIQMLSATLQAQGQNPSLILSQAEKDGKLLGLMSQLRDNLTLKWIAGTCKIVE